MRSSLATLLAAGSSLAASANALDLDVNDQNSIRQVVSTITTNMANYYQGDLPGNAPGLLPNSGQPGGYAWWEGGEFFGGLIDYWYFTGDSQYNNITIQGMEFQRGEGNDYEPSNYTTSLGNDDIAFWALTAMNAVEEIFPNPPSDEPSWLALAQAVWNRQHARWDDATCGGGLRWQILSFNGGYTYKNAITQGCFFQLGARLGLYTGNQTYLDWASKSYEWTASKGVIDDKYNVWDGTHIESNCSTVDALQWTYNVGVFLYGAACMWNATGDDATWRPRVEGFLNAASVFFPNSSNYAVSGVMNEVACEDRGSCNMDQLSFKSDLARWMWQTVKVAPFTEDQVKAYMIPTAQAAAASCQSDGSCGMKWSTGSYDGDTGIGQQLNALQAIQGLLIDDVAGPATAKKGGISIGDPSAGTGPLTGTTGPGALAPITSSDRAGAGILTFLMIVGILGGATWMLWHD